MAIFVVSKMLYNVCKLEKNLLDPPWLIVNSTYGREKEVEFVFFFEFSNGLLAH